MREIHYRPRPDDFVEVRLIRFNYRDIFTVVEKFYKEVADDPLLQIPFQSVSDWPHHIENITHFWWTQFGGGAYLDVSYDPIGKHFKAGFDRNYLERWLGIFRIVLKENLSFNQAEVWEIVAVSMGMALERNNEILKQRTV